MTLFRDSLTIGVVIERRALANAWASETWQPIGVLPAEPGFETRRLRDDGTIAQWLAGPVELTLHRSDVASYRYNLAGERPGLFVALRRDDEAGPIPWRVLLVTAAPDEAQKLMDCGEDVIEAVPMPDFVRGWIEAFAALCPADEPFEKRQRKNWRGEAGNR
ncbi:MAG: DUF3305 domain-containing protein [Alphaproteobacteria bacterium]|nr:DUF3305 domain-containing protein [Alphaproteobacteria bacterium]